MSIDDTEIEDLHAVLSDTGCFQDDFELSVIADHPPADEAYGVFWERCTIIVRCKKNGIAHMFDAGGHGTNWVSGFEQDLRAGAFGFVTRRP